MDWGTLVSNNGMSGPAWAFFTTIVLGIIGILRVAVENRKKTRDEVLPKLEAVRKLSEPTGNGFAKRVLDGQSEIIHRLRELESAMETQEQTMTRHLEAHITERREDRESHETERREDRDRR